jgi:hypothetical protein
MTNAIKSQSEQTHRRIPALRRVAADPLSRGWFGSFSWIDFFAGIFLHGPHYPHGI